jgi:hypothetical protein
VNNLRDVEDNDEHALDIVHLSCLFQSQCLDFQCMANAFFRKCLSDHCQGLHRTFSKICTKFDAVPLSDLFVKSHQARYTSPNKRTKKSVKNGYEDLDCNTHNNTRSNKKNA